VRARVAAIVERVWRSDDAWSRLCRSGLGPLAALYGGAIALRNAAYDRGWLRVVRIPALVVSVGSLAVGGSGKTPLSLWMAERLAAQGYRVAIVARGYHRRRRGLVVVGVGRGPLVGPDEGGDEAVMLARRFPGPVIVAERRGAAAAHACAALGSDAIVLDDGFQHRALHRDVDLVLVASELRGVRLLPAGPLREPWSALRRADAVLTAGPPPGNAQGVPVFRIRTRATGLVGVRDGVWVEERLEALGGASVVAVTGIARPERFLSTLSAWGIRVTRHLAFPDHHRYRGADVQRIVEASCGSPVITTEKDLVKLERWPALAGARALRLALEVEEEEQLLALLRAADRARQVASRPD